ncbi:6-carboxytetrahydropterin synthase [Allofrancisella guangzhouensis]|uniref:6-pyruvoyl trahydropterin synthase family protein n=1 Tax=Allofrancisella guangzhouensis TaxID=594679 RepID=UPI00068B1FD0|nr:6-carboxytetrahydropterin synthase [Allofrancisella guangzhouensis]MBK2027395.1 6-carboxytetrahydropterin synthase [Allofrancisella guangzhouensis]MBK2043671.1 6-carboxytetrahydropterin synthase [Allofrancisella guangzhouensis]MBK2045189.1 6-carboxytetrahydropterin synthase [Allofrancisella guangzhouensis]
MNSLSTVIELFREDMKFSAAHFTIFSETQRECLHGHNFQVYAIITAPVIGNNLSFDYTICRKEILNLCYSLNERCLMPSKSPYLKIEKQHRCYMIKFDKTKFVLPEEDVLLLPIKNITTEGLAQWFVKTIASNKDFYGLEDAEILTIKIATAPGQYASATVLLKEFN